MAVLRIGADRAMGLRGARQAHGKVLLDAPGHVAAPVPIQPIPFDTAIAFAPVMQLTFS